MDVFLTVLVIILMAFIFGLIIIPTDGNFFD